MVRDFGAVHFGYMKPQGVQWQSPILLLILPLGLVQLQNFDQLKLR